MSIPRTLSLRECRDGLRLVQRPVRELAALRADHTDGLANKIRGRELDIELEVAVTDEKPIELAVFKGERESTVVGYSPAEKQLYIDRRQSGVVDFHPAFAGVYRAPLSLRDGVLRLRVLIDRSSIEVFADDGVVVSTNRVFPNPDSDRVDLTAVGSKVMRFDAWRMKSVWPAP
jgi:fructan beta-fructosidase